MKAPATSWVFCLRHFTWAWYILCMRNAWKLFSLTKIPPKVIYFQIKKLAIQMWERCGTKFPKTALQEELEQQASLLTWLTCLSTTLDSRGSQSVNFFAFKTELPVVCIPIIWKLSMHYQHAFVYVRYLNIVPYNRLLLELKKKKLFLTTVKILAHHWPSLI